MPRSFSLVSAEQRLRALVRCRFSEYPRQRSAEDVPDALNPVNYVLAGPGVARVAAVLRVPADIACVDLLLSAPLAEGRWTLACANVAASLGEVVSGPPVAFAASASAAAEPPLSDRSAEEMFRADFNPALVGPAWSALICGISVGDQMNRDDAAAARTQASAGTATGEWLDRIAGGWGAVRPPGVGMDDPAWRQLALLRRNAPPTSASAWRVLELFYGTRAVRGSVSTGPEPFDLPAGKSLVLRFDDARVFEWTTEAVRTADELAGALRRSLLLAREPAQAAAWVGPAGGRRVVLLGTPGPRSSVAVVGGTAVPLLGLPDQVDVNLVSLPTWTIVAGQAGSRWTCGTGVDLSAVRPDDFAVVSGSEFSPGNRGWFPVVGVRVTYSGGSPVQVVELAGRGMAGQGGVVQVAASHVTFWRPAAHRPEQPRPWLSEADSLRFRLPATTAAVVRRPPVGWYLQQPRDLPGTYVLRGGVLRVRAPGHSLATGQQVSVTGRPDTAPPAATAGNGSSTTDTSQLSRWTRVADPTHARRDHQAATWGGGVLLVGGYDGTSHLSSCELLSLAPTTLGDGTVRYTYTWSNGPALLHAVSRHHLVSPAAGRLLGVLVTTGGYDGAERAWCAALLPDGWTPLAPLNNQRYWHGASALPGGDLLVTGGVTGGVPTLSAERYDQRADAWSAAADLLVARDRHATCVLADGRVLVAGGRATAAGALTNKCEVYDPNTDAWTLVGSMAYARRDHRALLLPDGRVLVVGGYGYLPRDDGTPVKIAAAEAFDPATGQWSGAGRMLPRGGAVLDAHPSGSAFAAGGGPVVTEVLSGGRWRPGPAAAPTYQDGAQGTWVAGAYVLQGGTDAGGAVLKVTAVLVPAAERWATQAVASGPIVVTDPDHFELPCPTAGYSAGSCSVDVVRAAGVATPAAYCHAPDGVAWTSTGSEVTTVVQAGAAPGVLRVADAAGFPDAPGWVVLDFGRARQQVLPYVGRPDAGTLRLGPRTEVAAEVPVGTPVRLLASAGPLDPEDSSAARAAWLTADDAGLAGARAALADLAPAGYDAEFGVTYPGVRGLVGEGRTDCGAAVWG